MSQGSQHVAVVTGSSGGIGSAIVELFVMQGWDVIGIDRAATDRNAGEFIKADLASVRDVLKTAKVIRARYGRIHAIVHNAAEQVVKPLIETTPEEWDRTMSANVRPAYLLTAELHEALAAAPGTVINIASVHAIATSPGMAAYAASKGALVALTRAMALELAPAKIRVNAVLPGAVDTPMLAAGLKRSKSSM